LVIGWRLDGHDLLVVILSVKVFEWNRADWSIWIVFFEGSVSDERRNILFELGKIRNDVVFSEVNVALIVHFVGNHKEEFTLLEHINHI